MVPIAPYAYDIDDNSKHDAHVAGLTPDLFTKITGGPHVTDATRSFGICWVDYDDDGYLDLYVANAAYPTAQDNCLHRNNGDGTYSIVEDSPVTT
jgi:hypothetical protein